MRRNLKRGNFTITRILALAITIIMLLSITQPIIMVSASSSFGFASPMKSGTTQGTGYEHAGLDIHAPIGTPIYAVADGKITYSEYGHTENTGSHETAYSVKILLDKPFNYGGVTYISAYYTHMQKNLVYNVACNKHGGTKSNTISVKKGDLIGYSGTANYAGHLHFAFEGNATSNYKMSGTAGTLNILGLSYNQKLNGDSVTLSIISIQSNRSTGTTNDKFDFSAVITGASRVELQFNGNSTIYRMNSSDNKNYYLNGNSLNAGNRTITITASDSNGRSVSKTLNVTVTDPTNVRTTVAVVGASPNWQYYNGAVYSGGAVYNINREKQSNFWFKLHSPRASTNATLRIYYNTGKNPDSDANGGRYATIYVNGKCYNDIYFPNTDWQWGRYIDITVSFTSGNNDIGIYWSRYSSYSPDFWKFELIM